jgi:hypothetical protein
MHTPLVAVVFQSNLSTNKIITYVIGERQRVLYGGLNRCSTGLGWSFEFGVEALGLKLNESFQWSFGNDDE